MQQISSPKLDRNTLNFKSTTFFSVVLFSLFFWGCHSTASPIKTAANQSQNPDTITVIFGGDMMGHGPQIQAALNDSTQEYNYLPWFRYIKSYIQSADFAIANLEVTLAGPPYQGYPQFSSPDKYAKDIYDAGFNVLVTANNHSQDGGKNGLIRTLNVLDSFKIPHTGTFRDTQEFERNYPLMLEKKGVKIAILNFTYGTNGLIVKHPTMVNLIDTIWIERAINKAKQNKADIIIPVVHWGVEYQRHENKEQQLLASFLARKGCHAIVGMHPHVIQPIKTVKNSFGQEIPVAYSLGNFVSNQRERFKDGGIMFKLTFVRGAAVNGSQYTSSSDASKIRNDKSSNKTAKSPTESSIKQAKNESSSIALIEYSHLPFWIHKVKPFEGDPHFGKGYWMLTEKELPLLQGEALINAKQFFEDTRELLSK